MKVSVGGSTRAASTVVRFVLPTSVTSAGPRTISPSRASTARFCLTGAASTIRSASASAARSALPTVSAPDCRPPA